MEFQQNHNMDDPQPSTSAGAGPRPKTPILLTGPGILGQGLTPIIVRSPSGKLFTAYPTGTTTKPHFVAIRPKLKPTRTTPLEPAVQGPPGHFAPQIIQFGDQQLVLTDSPNGPQLFPITTMSTEQRGGGYSTLAPAPAPNPPLQSPTSTSFGSGSIGTQGGAFTGTPAPATPHINFNRSTPLATSSIPSRKGAEFPSSIPPEVSFEPKRRHSPEKQNRGLRYYSTKVLEKVRVKGTTTYKEVADELVHEFVNSKSHLLTPSEIEFHQKNICRRVYDALNILVGVNIISKGKKEIKWIGMPTKPIQESTTTLAAQREEQIKPTKPIQESTTTLAAQREEQIKRVKEKTEKLRELIVKQVAFRGLIQRNEEREKESGPPPACGSVHLPFLLCKTSNETPINVVMSQDRSEYLLNFNNTFELHDDIVVLKRMDLALGLDKDNCTEENIAKAKALMPDDLAHSVDIIAKPTNDYESEFASSSLGTEPGYFNQVQDEDDAQGANGEDDAQGANGEYDAQGANGQEDAHGANGEDHAQGANGEDNAQGANGEYDIDESMLESFGESMPLNDDEDYPLDLEVLAALHAINWQT